MEKSHAVYYDDKKILFCQHSSPGPDSDNAMAGNVVNWDAFTRFLQSDKSLLVFTGKDPSKLFRQFSTLFHCIDAAGGLVTDPSGYLLFIFRRGRWDLPKGTVEKYETVQKAALREVEEECGIGNLQVVRTLPGTYHVYPLDQNRWALKTTHWFFMRTTTCCQAEPQTSEGITHAEWKHPDLLDEVFANTYANIRELLNLSLPHIKK